MNTLMAQKYYEPLAWAECLQRMVVIRNGIWIGQSASHVAANPCGVACTLLRGGIKRFGSWSCSHYKRFFIESPGRIIPSCLLPSDISSLA